MRGRELRLFKYVFVWGLALITIAGGILFNSGFPWDRWFYMLVFIGLTLYLHFVSKKLPQEMNYSLFTSTIFPVIYLFGPTAGMLIAVVAGLGDGIFNKKSFTRTLFNISQLALSTLAGSIIYEVAIKEKIGLWYHGAFALGLAALVYTYINLLLVAIMASISTKTNFKNRLITLGREAFFSSLGISFVGIIFALFVDAYSIVGLVIFSVFLVYLARLLALTVELSGEKVKRQELEEELLIDEMTQAYNFRFLNNWLEDSREENVAVLFVDIDDFKNFNDVYGHAEGDAVLKNLTKTIKDNIRSTDSLIRYGGDEFVVLLPNQNKENALKVAKRIKEKLSQLPYALKEHPITVSIGVASAPYDTADKHQLLSYADQAMYMGKMKGKDDIHLWTVS